MPATILWLENGLDYARPHAQALAAEGHHVTLVSELSRAETLIVDYQYDLLILDVMIPTRTKEENESYPPNKTIGGMQTGFVFYCDFKERLKIAGTKVLILTQRPDPELFHQFREAGLPPEQYASKFSLRRLEVFVGKVTALLTQGQEQSVQDRQIP